MPIAGQVPTAWPICSGMPVRAAHRQHAACSARWAWSCHFPAKFKLRVLDPVTFDVASGPGPLPTQPGVRGEPKPIRAAMQESLYDMLRHRRSVWFG